ncbi:MAG: DNA polymerase/3'-5' exonuclease PolX [Patescibacteria group bacterium]
MTNSEIAKILRETALLCEMKGIEFKPRAYEKAASEIEASQRSVAEIYAKFGIEGIYKNPETKIASVGRGIAEHIVELLEKGYFAEYKKLKKEILVDLESLSGIEGVGPRGILKLYKKLGVKNIAELEKAAKAGKIRSIAGFGEKSEKKILEGIEFKKKFSGRFVLGFIMPQILEIENRLKKLKEVEKIAVAGSVRRMKETVGDCDILIVSDNPKPVMDFFVKMPEAAKIIAHGETKSAVKLSNGLDVDLRVVPAESFGAAIQYFTGSKDHNIVLRKIAIEKGWKLNEYGLFQSAEKTRNKRGITRKLKILAGETEEVIYEKLGLKWIPPELRENSGEIEAARKGKLPDLIGYGDLKGDLQIQTNWTDGVNSIEEMAKEAIKRGLEYIAITDHTKALAMTGGLDEKKLIKQMKEIDKINFKFKKIGVNFRVLKGAEVNILKDGSLDIKDEVLAKLEIVGAAVHSHFNLSRKEQTARIIRAMKNKNVDVIFHPTGRIIGRREPYEIDIGEIVKAAKETGTILEIDAYPDRLDLKDEYVRRAVKSGVKLAIDSDAHAAAHIQYLEYGVAQARRGWAEKKDIINAWPLEKMIKFLKSK